MALGSTLSGKRILIVEDDFLIGASLSDYLTRYGCIVSGPVFSVRDAVEIMDRKALDGAVLDYRVQDGPSLPVALRLRQEGVPIVIVTAYQRDHLPAELQSVPYLAKPILPEMLIEVISRTWLSR